MEIFYATARTPLDMKLLVLLQSTSLINRANGPLDLLISTISSNGWKEKNLAANIILHYTLRTLLLFKTRSND